MRRLRDYEILQPVYDEAHVAQLAHPRWLTTARFEPVFRERLGAALVDLVFERDKFVLVVHAVELDMPALGSLYGPAVLWPLSLPISNDAAEEVEEYIFPWLRTLVRGRSASAEEIRSYQPSETFATARNRGFRGAVPLGVSLVAVAPFVYARRFARDADVRIACGDAYNAASMLGTIARAIDIDFTVARRDDVANRWYGDTVLSTIEKPDVVIVENLSEEAARDVAFVVACCAQPGAPQIIVPQPIPCDHLFTFDAADAPEARRFSVLASSGAMRSRRPNLASAAIGGSAGKLQFILREDAGYAPDADTDGAYELARRLRAEDLSVEISIWNESASIAEVDLVHIFGAAGSPHGLSAMNQARERGLPFVLSLDPLMPDYGTNEEDSMIAALHFGVDEATRQLFLKAKFAGALLIDGIEKEKSEVTAGKDRIFERLAAEATMILLDISDDPEMFVKRFPKIERSRVSLQGLCIADELDDAVDPADHALIPRQPFALVYAPFVRRSNIATLLAATYEANLNVVLAGPVSDVEHMITLRRCAGRDTLILPDPLPATAAALYRRAAAIVDISHRPTGPGRLVRGVLCGATPLVPIDSCFAWFVEPEDCFLRTDPASIVRVIKTAIERTDGPQRTARTVARLAASLDQRSSTTSVLTAYARAAAPS